MSTELTSGITEGGTRVRFQQRKHGAARRALSEAGDAALKATAGFGGTHFGAAAPHQAHFGLLVVSCERGDIRQTADGLRVYGDEACWKVSLPVGVTGRDLMVAEFYDAVAYGAPALHGLRWGKATLEVSLAVLESASTRREVLLRHQIATAD
jgi:phthalate 4,5-cis-dihydrodiol dehydrogenase